MQYLHHYILLLLLGLTSVQSAPTTTSRNVGPMFGPIPTPLIRGDVKKGEDVSEIVKGVSFMGEGEVVEMKRVLGGLVGGKVERKREGEKRKEGVERVEKVGKKVENGGKGKLELMTIGRNIEGAKKDVEAVAKIGKIRKQGSKEELENVERKNGGIEKVRSKDGKVGMAKVERKIEGKETGASSKLKVGKKDALKMVEKKVAGVGKAQNGEIKPMNGKEKIERIVKVDDAQKKSLIERNVEIAKDDIKALARIDKEKETVVMRKFWKKRIVKRLVKRMKKVIGMK